jgi:hypothetical protein
VEWVSAPKKTISFKVASYKGMVWEGCRRESVDDIENTSAPLGILYTC